MQAPKGFKPHMSADEKRVASLDDVRELLSGMMEVAKSKDALTIFSQLVESNKALMEENRLLSAKMAELIDGSMTRDTENMGRIGEMLANNRAAMERMAVNGESGLGTIMSALEGHMAMGAEIAKGLRETAKTQKAIVAGLKNLEAGMKEMKRPSKMQMAVKRDPTTLLIEGVEMQ